MATQQLVFKLGKSTVLVPDDEFADGYTNGIVAHPKDPDTPLTVTALRQMIAESMFDVKHLDDWNTGYIVGAISGLREGDRGDKPDGKEVQLGSVALRLNRWRFCEGYFNGRLDYEEGQHERTSPTLLSAHDLLRYIAHRDPKTNMYYLGEDELACLEETLGQLVGYLCTALFSKPTRAHDTELLPMTVFQEA